ncbi:MAG: hypothetical protein ACK2T5_11380, partial [Anaerolineales bacterium]
MPNPLIALIFAAIVAAIALWLFRPNRGLFWRWQRTRELTERVLREDALKHIFQCEIHNDKPSLKSLAGALNVSTDQAAELLASLEAHELLITDGASFRRCAHHHSATQPAPFLPAPVAGRLPGDARQGRGDFACCSG